MVTAFKRLLSTQKRVVPSEGLFAASDSDYGRTNVVKHKIATGSAHPIKQPPRRLPDVLAKEVDKQVKGMLNNEVISPSIIAI
jgi:hypothetical protein